MPACTDDQFVEVDLLGIVERPIINDLWVIFCIHQTFAIHVQTTLEIPKRFIISQKFRASKKVFQIICMLIDTNKRMKRT